MPVSFCVVLRLLVLPIGVWPSAVSLPESAHFQPFLGKRVHHFSVKAPSEVCNVASQREDEEATTSKQQLLSPKVQTPLGVQKGSGQGSACRSWATSSAGPRRRGSWLPGVARVLCLRAWRCRLFKWF